LGACKRRSGIDFPASHLPTLEQVLQGSNALSIDLEFQVVSISHRSVGDLPSCIAIDVEHTSVAIEGKGPIDPFDKRSIREQAPRVGRLPTWRFELGIRFAPHREQANAGDGKCDSMRYRACWQDTDWHSVFR
jgi:hypothetical protein